MPYIIPRTDPRKITADDLKKNKVLALDISGSVSKYLSEHKGQALSIGHIMSFTQAAWKLAPEKANDVDLIFACCKTPDKNRQVIGVFVFGRKDENGKPLDVFFQSPLDEEGRMVFLAQPAEEETWNRYVGLMLGPVKHGEANPVRYYESSNI
ncbi:MAG: hypothetical protein K2K32_02065 [Muribaculaceae bacterium]|nr:hypothetical protein [Muribaculaceae bacterium]